MNPLAYGEVLREVTTDGSPMLLAAAGRLLGMGPAEVAAMKLGGVPWWTTLIAGLGIGFVVGARTTHHFPEHVPVWVRGERT